MYLALSNTEAKVATNPSSEHNFLWFNAQLVNKAETKGEYPVEHVYRYALSKENIVKYLEHYLVFVPAVEEINAKGELEKKPSFTIFPRYHQFRASKNLAEDVKIHVEDTRALGKKYLINHSAGAGKTLTIAWMADLLDSLYTSDNKKVFDNIIILTDRKSLDKNVKEDLEKFNHLRDKLNFSDKSRDLANYLEKDRDIIVSTIHKFAHIQEKLQNNDVLKNRKVAFLIDEAHRSQDGKLALTMREYFNKESEDKEDSNADDEDLKSLEKLNINNQVFVAFTATTTPKTVSYFGNPFDVYSEQEAIAEGYILDVAQNIISYETLYNLRLKEAIPDKDFPVGTVSMALRTLAFNDDSLIQYKSEVIVKLFEEEVAQTIKGKGKAMVVTSSRLAGLKYFENLKTILEEKKLPYKVLFAFSDFTHPETKETIEEKVVNNLDSDHGGKPIEDVFDHPEYRILVVANKFQTGFDQPLLSAMFLDKAVKDVNAIQTVSRLNRRHNDKEQDDILVVDFTNNAKEIFSTFNKHREGSPYKEKEPDKAVLKELFEDIKNKEVFTDEEIELYINAFIEAEEEARERNSTPDAILSNLNQDYREKFKKALPALEDQKEYVGLLRRYKSLFYFMAKFFKFDQELIDFVVFAEAMSDMLIRKGKTSEMKSFLDKVELSKGAIKYHGKKTNLKVAEDKPKKTGLKFGKGGNAPARTTIESAIAEIEIKYPISKDEVVVIKEICTEVSGNYEIKERVKANKNNKIYLSSTAKPKIKQEVKRGYIVRDMVDKLEEPIYSERGGIISLMGNAIIKHILTATG
jgi:type I restriction enzyme R subunit